MYMISRESWSSRGRKKTELIETQTLSLNIKRERERKKEQEEMKTIECKRWYCYKGKLSSKDERSKEEELQTAVINVERVLEVGDLVLEDGRMGEKGDLVEDDEFVFDLEDIKADVGLWLNGTTNRNLPIPSFFDRLS